MYECGREGLPPAGIGQSKAAAASILAELFSAHGVAHLEVLVEGIAAGIQNELARIR